MSATIEDRVVADLSRIMCLFNHTPTPIPGFPFSPFRTPDHSSLTRARRLTDIARDVQKQDIENALLVYRDLPNLPRSLF